MSIAQINILGELSAETYATIATALTEAVADVTVDSVVMVIDSPGGDVCASLFDLTDLIFASPKPVLAYVTGTCASCAFWLASQCDSISASRGSFLGGIGLYGILEDSSQKLANDGIRLVRVATSESKGADVEGLVIGETATKSLQSELAQLEALFHGDIARARPSIDLATAGTGEIWIASVAQQMGLIDRVESFDEFITRNFQATTFQATT
jgi:ClpP class serine protease